MRWQAVSARLYENMAANERETARRLRNALRRLIAQPSLAEKLKAESTAAEAAKELRISEELREDLLNILNDLNQNASVGEPSKDTSEHKDRANKAEQFFDNAFKQLQTAYRRSMFMSTSIFAIGLIFLLLAVVQAILRPDQVGTTAIVGGIGIVQIVALFYRNPLADIARTVSNTQQAKMAITSYIIGLSLVRDAIASGPTKEEHIRLLIEMTEKSLLQLQTYAEDHTPPKAD
jgi:hypothetical protein